MSKPPNSGLVRLRELVKSNGSFAEKLKVCTFGVSDGNALLSKETQQKLQAAWESGDRNQISALNNISKTRVAMAEAHYRCYPRLCSNPLLDDDITKVSDEILKLLSIEGVAKDVQKLCLLLRKEEQEKFDKIEQFLPRLQPRTP